MERFIGILGMLAILGIAYVMSNNKKNIDLIIKTDGNTYICPEIIGTGFFVKN